MSNILDKVTILYVDWNKEVEYESYSEGCSGSASAIPNAKHEGVIYKIEEIETTYYNFYEDEDESVGLHSYKDKKYYVTGWGQPLTESAIEYFKKKQNE